MTTSCPQRPHTFHIPVMGTGFTIDTPLRIAKYGISSVISLVDDTLIEQMRAFYCKQEGLPYSEITGRQENARALRITAYLDLLGEMIQKQVTDLQNAPFEPGSQITRYFDMLPDSPLKQSYQEMLATTDSTQKAQMQQILRTQATPGSIDVNIMTKLDRAIYRNGEKLSAEYSDAMAALRGYANSTLKSSLVLSAGMNPRLYSYIGQFDDFFPDENGSFKKRITLKVSDYRSAIIQGKFLAKKGIWISEFRIESGLNCGGHAFATNGELMGPILEEFKVRRTELINMLHPIYLKGLEKEGRTIVKEPNKVCITVQGGIGTTDENEFLLKYYNVDGTGWCTPFMLVPEVANVDKTHLDKLVAAGKEDVYLSDSSPLSVLYWNLRNSASEIARLTRIKAGKPGSACPKGHAVTNSEFTEAPICLASRHYQKQKLENLPHEGLNDEQMAAVKEDVLIKCCICHELGGSVKIMHGIEPDATPTVCCGPNIVNFSKTASLEEMVSHIYGRLSLMTNPDRPHMFVTELAIYIENFCKELEKYRLELSHRTPKYFGEVKKNLLNGIEYYRQLANEFVEETQHKFLDELKILHEKLEGIGIPA
ncbi:MAG: hypothetical protein K9M57_09425 [Phycisphaerae bacterium]|nr:hypothetical protein [Phycisphaerae bacterium]